MFGRGPRCRVRGCFCLAVRSIAVAATLYCGSASYARWDPLYRGRNSSGVLSFVHDGRLDFEAQVLCGREQTLWT